jgi:hypothetical protein
VGSRQCRVPNVGCAPVAPTTQERPENRAWRRDASLARAERRSSPHRLLRTESSQHVEGDSRLLGHVLECPCCGRDFRERCLAALDAEAREPAQRGTLEAVQLSLGSQRARRERHRDRRAATPRPARMTLDPGGEPARLRYTRGRQVGDRPVMLERPADVTRRAMLGGDRSTRRGEMIEIELRPSTSSTARRMVSAMNGSGVTGSGRGVVSVTVGMATALLLSSRRR